MTDRHGHPPRWLPLWISACLCAAAWNGADTAGIPAIPKSARIPAPASVVLNISPNDSPDRVRTEQSRCAAVQAVPAPTPQRQLSLLAQGPLLRDSRGLLILSAVVALIGYLMVRLVCESRHRKRIEAELNATQKSIETRLAERTRELTEYNETIRRDWEEYREVFNATSDALLIHDEAGRILDVNESMCGMFGYDRATAITLSINDFSLGEPPYSQTEAMENVRRAIDAGPQVFQWPCRRSNGELFWSEVALRSGLIAGRNRVIASVRDISKRKQVETELERTSLLLEAVMEQSPIPTVVTSAPDMVARYANPAATEYLGISDEPSYIGTSLADITKQQSWQDFRPDGTPISLLDMPLARALRGETTRNEEFFTRRKDGSIRWEFASGTPVYNRRGELIAALVVFPDITEFKQTQEKLLQERAFSDTVINSLPGIFYVFSAEGHMIRWNDNHQKVLGYPPEEMSERHILQLVAEEDRDLVTRKMEEVLSRGSATLEVRLLGRDGNTSPFLMHGVHMTVGDKAYLVGTGLDISERKQAEAALRESEERLRAITDNLPGAVYQFYARPDGQMGLYYVGDRFEALFGFPIEPIQECLPRFISCVAEEHRAAFLTSIKDAVREVREWDFEGRFVKPNGDEIWFRGVSKPVRQREELVFNGLMLDITERKRAELALLAEKQLSEGLFSSLPSIAYVFDENGNLMRWNHNLGKVLGWSDEEIPGMTIADAISPKDRDRVASVIRDAFNRGEASTELNLLCRDGREIPAYCTGVHVTIGGKPCIIGIGVDLSERLAAEAEKTRLQEQLQQAMKMEAVGRLAGEIAHDFNNLLTAIGGNADLARMDLTSSHPAAQHLDEVTKAAEIAASLTRQLLAFSRRQIIEPKVLNLNDLVDNLQKMLGRLIGEDIALQTKLADGLGSVKVDPAQFEQVLVNLAVNARDAMPNGGRLTIETANVDLDENYHARHPTLQPGRYVMLAVSDTGHGITPEVRQHLFEPFFTTKPKGRGTGLGLAMVFGAVQQAGGAVEVYSEVGLGTTFKVYVPRIEEQAERYVHGRPVLDLPGGTATVLLVEDEEIVRTLAQMLLKRLGYSVLTAAHGDEAWSLMRNHDGKIDLLITDVVMPGINGRELAERVVKLHPDMKVLFTSGYTEDVIVHHGVLRDNLNFLGKPYSIQALAEKIAGILHPEQS